MNTPSPEEQKGGGEAMTNTVVPDADLLALHLSSVLKAFVGVAKAHDVASDDVMPDDDATLDDTLPTLPLRFYCPHCGRSGPKRDKVKHDDACWYHNARSVLAAYRRYKKEAKP